MAREYITQHQIRTSEARRAVQASAQHISNALDMYSSTGRAQHLLVMARHFASIAGAMKEIVDEHNKRNPDDQFSWNVRIEAADKRAKLSGNLVSDRQEPEGTADPSSAENEGGG